ncbi:hypothetical protein G3567_11505 [Psychroflexus sp. YR1-1]|uniref:Uncharacterized protein n=1 Tax=Psychroflexus aurantiacus TaxID=2709310 RepID=A0A6B3R5C6_9FLAO|nr:hypothetical protein [Psychroflexus aurantiacus]NEV94770.1 hypothetical protein [Psychroflexus aurantiacus]
MRAILVLILWFGMQTGWSQTGSLNAYEHVIIPMKFDFQNETNEYQLNILARVLLQEEGFKVFMDTEERPLQFMGNTCEALFLEVEDTSGFLNISVIFRLKDCYDTVLFESEKGQTKLKDFKDGYQKALRLAFSSLADQNYRYDSSLEKAGPRSVLATSEGLETSKMTERYPDKNLYKFGGQTFWLVKQVDGAYSLLMNEGSEHYAELEQADKGSFIFNSDTINGAAFFDVEGNLQVEYMDQDLGEVQSITFRKIDQ